MTYSLQEAEEYISIVARGIKEAVDAEGDPVKESMRKRKEKAMYPIPLLDEESMNLLSQLHPGGAESLLQM